MIDDRYVQRENSLIREKRVVSPLCRGNTEQLGIERKQRQAKQADVVRTSTNIPPLKYICISLCVERRAGNSVVSDETRSWSRVTSCYRGLNNSSQVHCNPIFSWRIWSKSEETPARSANLETNLDHAVLPLDASVYNERYLSC